MPDMTGGRFTAGREPRMRLMGFVLLIGSMTFADGPCSLAVAAAATAALFLLSGISLERVLRRLMIPAIPLAILVIVLALTSGERILLGIGPLQIRTEGTLFGIYLIGRIVCIITTVTILVEAVPFGENLEAMRGLGVPNMMIDILMLTARYIPVAVEDMKVLRRAAKLRGFGHATGLISFMYSLPMMAGSVLVRGHIRTSRIHAAMILRGYGDGNRTDTHERPGARDILILSAFASVSLTLILLSLKGL